MSVWYYEGFTYFQGRDVGIFSNLENLYDVSDL